jgi:hypothetical protein
MPAAIWVDMVGGTAPHGGRMLTARVAERFLLKLRDTEQRLPPALRPLARAFHGVWCDVGLEMGEVPVL